VIAEEHIDTLDPDQLREVLHARQAEVALKDEVIERHERDAAFAQATIRRSPSLRTRCGAQAADVCRRSEAHTAEEKQPHRGDAGSLAALAREVEQLDSAARRIIERIPGFYGVRDIYGEEWALFEHPGVPPVFA